MKNNTRPNPRARVALALGLAITALCLSAPAKAQSLGGDTLWRQARDTAIARVINPDDYECGPTDFEFWFYGKLGAIENFGAFVNIYSLNALNWAADYNLLFNNDSSDDYLGVHGEQTKELIKRHKDNQRFWDVSTGDVLLLGMHGVDLADDAKMVPLVELYLYFGFIPPVGTAQQIVDYIQYVIESDPGLGYDNPLFTLNAFAAWDYAGLPDKIIMGDGIMQMLGDLGLGNNAPDAVHAHEFAHHVQHRIEAFTGLEYHVPEDTRRTELMADAFAAYYCAHARGATFQQKRIVEAFRASYLVGDCGFDDPGHHGTPNQREASAQWGASLAQAAQKQGHINSAVLILELFDAALPELVAPDAP